MLFVFYVFTCLDIKSSAKEYEPKRKVSRVKRSADSKGSEQPVFLVE